jgi:hypothetical protein
MVSESILPILAPLKILSAAFSIFSVPIPLYLISGDWQLGQISGAGTTLPQRWQVKVSFFLLYV